MYKEEMSKELIIRNLKDAGFNEEMICAFLNSYKNNELEKQISLLKSQRCILLGKLHKDKKQIDALDYLLYTIKKNL